MFSDCICEPEVKDGYHYIDWIGRYVGTCAWTPIETVSLALGLSQIGLWLFANVPQLWKNFRAKKVEAIHPAFLIIWMVGDITNLLGCILTRQLPFQLYTAVYFCCMDVLMLLQYWYYSRKGKTYGVMEEIPLVNRRGVLLAIVLVNLGLGTLVTELWKEDGGRWEAVGTRARSRELLGNSTLPSCQANSQNLADWEVMVGYVAAWVSAILYNLARLPQVAHNYRRSTTSGLSVVMFLIICLANIFYGASILLILPPIEPSFYGSTLPYLLGSLGPLIPSVVVLGQWCYYDRPCGGGRQRMSLE